jgi:hypothetical protein
MPEAAEAMGVCTVTCPVLMVGCSVTFGASGRLWLPWVVPGLCATGVAPTGARRR